MWRPARLNALLIVCVILRGRLLHVKYIPECAANCFGADQSHYFEDRQEETTGTQVSLATKLTNTYTSDSSQIFLVFLHLAAQPTNPASLSLNKT